VEGSELNETLHWKAFAGSALEGFQRTGERLSFVAQGEADPQLAPVDPQNPAGSWNSHTNSVNGEP
jgi:hypothetical protein